MINYVAGLNVNVISAAPRQVDATTDSIENTTVMGDTTKHEDKRSTYTEAQQGTCLVARISSYTTTHRTAGYSITISGDPVGVRGCV